MLRFLAPRAIPGVESIEGGSYRRTIEIGGRPGTMQIRRAGDPALELSISASGLTRVPHDAIGRARRIFALDIDPKPIADYLSRNRVLRHLVVATSGLRVPGAWDGFELAVRAVLGQQVSVKGASTLAGRLAARFGTPLEAGNGTLTHLFPRPDVLAEADVGVIGLPKARAATIRALSATVARGDFTFGRSTGLEDIVERLCAIPGIGPWTANYIAMRAFGESDAFPSSDLGLRRVLGRSGHPISPRELEGIATRWRPWRAYAAMYLWTAHAAGG